MTASYQYVNFDTVNQQYALLTTKPNATPVGYMQNPLTQANYIQQFASSTQQQLQRCNVAAVTFDGKTCIGFDELGQPYACDPATGTNTALVSGSMVVRCGTNSLTVSVEAYTGALSVH